MNFEQPPTIKKEQPIKKEDLTPKELEDALNSSEPIGPQMPDAELISEKEKNEKRELEDAINSSEPIGPQMPDADLEKKGPENLNSPEEEKEIEQGIKEAESLDDLINLFEDKKGIMGSEKLYSSDEVIKQIKFARDLNPDLVVGYITRNLGLRDKVKELLETKKSPAEQAEINKIKEEINANELDIESSENALGRIKDKEKTNQIQTLEERIKYAKDKTQELENDLDILEGKEINSIDNIGDKKIIIFKIKMKTGEGSEVQRGEEYSGLSVKESITVDDGIYLEENGHLKIKTSPIKSIKECKDGSYIIETTTSFYRLNIAA